MWRVRLAGRDAHAGIGAAHNADGRQGVERNFTQFAGRQTHEAVAVFLGQGALMPAERTIWPPRPGLISTL